MAKLLRKRYALRLPTGDKEQAISISARELLKTIRKLTVESKINTEKRINVADIISICQKPHFPQRIQSEIENILLARYSSWQDDPTYPLDYSGHENETAIFYCCIRSKNEQARYSFLKRFITNHLVSGYQSNALKQMFSHSASRLSFINRWCNEAVRSLELRIAQNEEINFLSWSGSLAVRFNADYAIEFNGGFYTNRRLAY